MSPLWYASRGLTIVMCLVALALCFHGALFAISAFLDRGPTWNRNMRHALIRLVLSGALIAGGVGVSVAADHLWLPAVSSQEEKKEGETDD